MPAPSAVTPPFAAGPRSVRRALAWGRQVGLLLESTNVGIFGVDMHGACTFINAAAAGMLGRAADSVLGSNMHALIHHTHADGRPYPEADCPIFNAFRLGLPCRIDNEVLWRADGSRFDAEYSSYPIFDAGQVQGAVVTLVDISERKRGEALLRRANDGLERRVAERTDELRLALGQLRELSAHADSVREDERTRIAREIHDELGSQLVALKLDVDWLAKRLADRPPLEAKCHTMGATIDRAVVNLGRIITDLRPSILDHQGLWAALEWQAQEFAAATELPVDLQMHLEAPSAASLPPQAERWAIAVFRIFQEMLSNAAKHARATSLRIRVYVDAPPEPMLYLTVEDDGVGIAVQPATAPRRYGVLGMHERAQHFGGRLRLVSVPARGTSIRLSMPLPT